MQCQDQVAVYIKELCQQLVCQLRSQNLQIGNSSDAASHTEIPSVPEIKRCWSDEVFGGQPAFQKAVITEQERFTGIRV